MLQKAKLKVTEFEVRKDVLIHRAPTKVIGDIIVPQIHLAHWTSLRVSNGLGGISIRKCWWGRF